MCCCPVGGGANGSWERPHPHCYTNNIRQRSSPHRVRRPRNFQHGGQSQRTFSEPPRLPRQLRSSKDLPYLPTRPLWYLVRLDHLDGPSGTTLDYRSLPVLLVLLMFDNAEKNGKDIIHLSLALIVQSLLAYLYFEFTFRSWIFLPLRICIFAEQKRKLKTKRFDCVSRVDVECGKICLSTGLDAAIVFVTQASLLLVKNSFTATLYSRLSIHRTVPDQFIGIMWFWLWINSYIKPQ